MNEYQEIMETHVIVKGRVCCKGHCCTFHDYKESEFKLTLETLKEEVSDDEKSKSL